MPHAVISWVQAFFSLIKLKLRHFVHQVLRSRYLVFVVPPTFGAYYRPIRNIVLRFVLRFMITGPIEF